MKTASQNSISLKTKTLIDNQNISSKITKLIDILNSKNYKLEGDEEALVNLSKNEKFKFSDIESFNEMFLILAKYVKVKLRMCYNMNKIKIEIDSSNYVNCLITNDFYENNNIIVIFPDRAIDKFGIFSKVSLVYESVKKGSMINFVEMGINLKYSVMITNPNKKNKSENLEDSFIQYEEIWKEIIKNKNIKKIVIISHKMASINIIKLMNKYSEDFKNKVNKIVMIDSHHNSMYEILSSQMKIEFENKCINYIISNQSEGTLLYSNSESMEGCENRSCGTLEDSNTHYLLSNEIKKYL